MRPELAIVGEREVDGVRILDIDTSKATYQGHAWRDMGDFGKRKFENFLFLERMQDAIQYIKIRYV